MQTLTWSSNLHTAVKKLKKLDLGNIESLFNNRKLMNSLCLSAAEEKAVFKSFTQKSSTSPNGQWV